MAKQVRMVNVKMEIELADELDRAAYWVRTTKTDIIESGVRHQLAQLQATHNKGRPFPPKPTEA